MYILEKDQSACLALGLVQMVWRMDARRSGHVQRSRPENILFLVLLRSSEDYLQVCCMSRH